MNKFITSTKDTSNPNLSSWAEIVYALNFTSNMKSFNTSCLLTDQLFLLFFMNKEL